MQCVAVVFKTNCLEKGKTEDQIVEGDGFMCVFVSSVYWREVWVNIDSTLPHMWSGRILFYERLWLSWLIFNP